jgi:hypothetical protein
MKKKITFDDGSSVEWVDKETLQYREGNYSALIWVDFEPGIFSSGKVIKASSINKWGSKPEDASGHIDERKKNEIIEKIMMYYKAFGKKCRVEIG